MRNAILGNNLNTSTSIIIIHKLVKMCPLPCSVWSFQCGIWFFLNFTYTFPRLFTVDWVYMIDDSKLLTYKFILSHFSDFVIYEAFCQKTTYVLNIYFSFCLLRTKRDKLRENLQENCRKFAAHSQRRHPLSAILLSYWLLCILLLETS